MIHIQNLYKTFYAGADPVLRGLNIHIQKGKLTYILGSSGCGKSVLLKHLLGLLKPDRGTIHIDGKDISKLTRAESVELKLKFGVLFQNSALFDNLSVFDNVAFPLREHTSLSEKEITQKVEKTLAILGMPTAWDKSPNNLSGGMRKRVGLARAIIREPSILLYDEPTTGLDPVTRSTVDQLIETLKRELQLTSVVISHDLSSAILLADVIAFLYQGQVVFMGTPSEFKKSQFPDIQEFLKAEQRSIQAFLD